VPTWLEILLVAIVVLMIALAVLGNVWNRRHAVRTRGELLTRLAAADQALAAAVATDKGWDRDVLEVAARDAFTAGFPGVAPAGLRLVLVDDRPGTDEDRAVFEAEVAGTAHTVTLLRSGDAWHAEG
jgi:type II secretory pathway pseudopilin PulG